MTYQEMLTELALTTTFPNGNKISKKKAYRPEWLATPPGEPVPDVFLKMIKTATLVGYLDVKVFVKFWDDDGALKLTEQYTPSQYDLDATDWQVISQPMQWPDEAL